MLKIHGKLLHLELQTIYIIVQSIKLVTSRKLFTILFLQYGKEKFEYRSFISTSE